MAKGSKRDDSPSTFTWSQPVVNPAPVRVAPSPVRNPAPVAAGPSRPVPVIQPAYNDSWSRSFTHGFHDVTSNGGGPFDPNSPNRGMVAVRVGNEVVGFRPATRPEEIRTPNPPVQPGVPEPPKKPRIIRQSSLTISAPLYSRTSLTSSPLARDKKASPDPERKKEPKICKPRPKDNRPKGGGGGGPRKFIPWCD